MDYSRGNIIRHKLMGKGVVINIKKDEKSMDNLVEVRLQNGNIERFYPEELELDSVVTERERAELDAVNRANKKRAEDLYGI